MQLLHKAFFYNFHIDFFSSVHENKPLAQKKKIRSSRQAYRNYKKTYTIDNAYLHYHIVVKFFDRFQLKF